MERVNLYEFLKTCEDLFERFGGHAGACGFLIKKEKFEELKQRLNSTMNHMLEENPRILVRENHTDISLLGRDITFDFVRALDMLAPFGNKNEKPVLSIENAVIEKPVYMGDKNQHVRFTAKGADGIGVACVMFNSAEDHKQILESAERVNIFGSADIQEWNGRHKLQFIVAGIES